MTVGLQRFGVLDETIRASRVLAVDDEAWNLELLSQMLGDDGYSSVVATTDSAKVPGLVRDLDPDIILLDMIMPPPDGFELLEALQKSAGALTYRPVLVLTADVTRATRERALALGATDFLTKPLDVTEVLLRIRNLLEARHLHRALAQQLRYAKRLEAVGRLAASITHEVNTPVQYVMQNLQFVREAFGELMPLLEAYGRLLVGTASTADPRLVQAVRDAEASADLDFLRSDVPSALADCVDGLDHILTIVNAMKVAGRYDPELPVPADLNQLVRSAVSLADTQARYVADVHLDLGDVPPVTCFPSAVVEALLNLLVNAKDAIEDATAPGERGRVTVSTVQAGDEVAVRVADTGTGIPEDVRGRVLVPFFTTKAPGRGTGQGLSLTHQIVVERHHGSLGFESEVGKGTTFTIRLPVGGPGSSGPARHA